jgi:hypothetical protein
MSYPKRDPDRANLHFLRLAEHLNMGNPAMADLLQRVTAVNTAKWGGDVVHGHAADQSHCGRYLARGAGSNLHRYLSGDDPAASAQMVPPAEAH